MPQTTAYINGREFEIITFSAKLTNVSKRVNGLSLAQGYLAVANDNRIYNTVTGKPILRGRFETIDNAIMFAQSYLEKYAPYFCIWQSYPEANIWAWCKYTVPGGIITFEMLTLLNMLTTITNEYVAKADVIAQGKAKKWRA